ncbi:MAG: hypothetical protein ACU0BF_13115 [Paracoccaceae bacterium]
MIPGLDAAAIARRFPATSERAIIEAPGPAVLVARLGADNHLTRAEVVDMLSRIPDARPILARAA